MIEVLTITDTGTCANCGRPISHLTGPGGSYWAHNADDGRGIYERHCAGALVATPTEESP